MRRLLIITKSGHVFFVEQLDLDPKLKAEKDNFRAAEALLKEATEKVHGLQVFGEKQLASEYHRSFCLC